MQQMGSQHSFLILGEQSLLVQCADSLLTRGHSITAVVSRNHQVRDWARKAGIPCHDRFEHLRSDDSAGNCDYLLSITNLRMLPQWLLDRARLAACNFHDGPLPRYAGLNAPVWALINGEKEYAVTWHEIATGADRGRILVQRKFPVAEDETTFGLNAQCYQAGLESFAELVQQIEQGTLASAEQDFSQRSYFGLADRPLAAATLDWTQPAGALARLIRALDFGRYPNPVVLPKVNLGPALLLAREAQVVGSTAGVRPGMVLEVTSSSLTVSCGVDALQVSRLTSNDGNQVAVTTVLRECGLAAGSVLPSLGDTQSLDADVRRAARHEGWWHEHLRGLELSELPFMSRDASGAPDWIRVTQDAGAMDAHVLVASFMLLVARLNNRTRATVAIIPKPASGGSAAAPYFSQLVVLSAEFTNDTSWSNFADQVTEQLQRIDSNGSWLADLPAREPELRAALTALGHIPFRLDWSATSGGMPNVLVDGARWTREGIDRLSASWSALVQDLQTPGMNCARAKLVSSAESEKLVQWQMPNRAPASSAGSSGRVHELIEAQVVRTPSRKACVFEDLSMSYQELNESANRVARYLQSLDVKRGDLVGVKVPRSLEMLIALLAVQKAGAAYVPLDPTYPADRLAFMVEDARLRVVLTREAVRTALARGDLSDGNLDVAGGPDDLAYVIYTSGSTGKPKGVMVEHRNVVNFFSGMDQRIGGDPGVWLAVTSISFDISVLELFWTLARGFTVALHGDAMRIKGNMPRAEGARQARVLDFGLFYWNVAKSESDYDAEKYSLLLESARYADTHGFNAVWTPERHFEAFGGLFPNPSVTSAALATITKNVKLRAGSCVVPLHSPIRVAEEWAVVDNLSNGRVGMSVASGWAPPDFAIRPESFANAKQVMFESTEIIKRLWRGETVGFPGPKGEVKVRTLPRPIQKELPIWVTTAGNIDTYIQAGKAGANVLTHLLGQTIEEVTEKVVAYRKAWADAGHPGRGLVTIMLHTLVGPDADAVEKIVRQPMKDYLKSAVFLVKAAAWQFPTFKKLSDEQGKTLDDFFAGISGQDMDDLLEFAFLRYFKTSGLFGTPEQCLEMVRRVELADADEIACLIDFGIKTDIVLEHLPYLDELRALSQAPASDEKDYSLPSLFQDEAVTHFQCTPTMATMLVSDPDSKQGLANLKHMMVGGEAMPPDLARSLSALVGGRVSNMYGPTETTIWSTVGEVNDRSITTNSVSIGQPLLDQSVYVLDPQQQPLPVGVSGELVVGGKGVTRGYWQRPELTAEKFLPDPYATGSHGARMYRTGDLGRFLPDGRIECLGRLDQQIKIRGFRVELGEIEAALREQPGITEAAVVLRELAPGDQRLLGYVCTPDGSDANVESLREGLLRVLPDFMVPAVLVTLQAMPQTPNGKIDRKALPLPNRPVLPGSVATANGSVPAVASGAEGLVMGIWQRALGISQISLKDNFFDIGGHSLLVIQVLKELREKCARPIQMTDLFRHTTIESLAKFLEGEGTPDAAAQRGRSRAEARRAAAGRSRP
jgi:natural product biosynthesis luciferase-like monooxygenase protein